MTASSVIGVDVGGTKIAAGTLQLPEGRWVPFKTYPTLRERGGRWVLNEVLQICRDLAGQITSIPGRPVAAIGIGLCELVGRTGGILSAHSLDWRALPVLEELGQIAPAILEADVRAAARAEALFGVGRGLGSFLHITIGTGISCCLMLDGRPHMGSQGLTGTLASSPLGPLLGIPSAANMTLEDLASGPALVARFRKAGGFAERGEEVVRAAADGNPTALQIIDSASAALGAHIGLLVNVLDPDAVVIGGGLGLSEGPYRERLLVAIRNQVWSEGHRGLPIVQARTGVDAGWLGAAAAAMERFDLPRPSLHLSSEIP